MTPRMSVIGASLRTLFGGDIGRFADDYWGNTVLAMRMNNQTDQFWSNVSAYLPMDSGQADGKGHAVTGTASVDTTNKKFGTSSALFNGTSDSLSLASSTDFGLGLGDYTVEGWIKTSSAGTLLDTRPSLSDYGLFYLTAGGFPACDHTTGPLVSTTSVTDNSWHYLTFVRLSRVLTIYVDGAIAGVFIANTDLGSTRPARVGATVAGTDWFAGNLDDFRITKGIARYASEFTPPKIPHFTGTAKTFVDETGKVATVSGNSSIQGATVKYGDGAAYFDGAGDCLTFPASSDWNFGTNDFTVELWYNREANDSSRVMLQIGDASNIIVIGEFAFSGSTYYCTAQIGGSLLTYTTYTVTPGQWVHVALVRYSGFCTLYMNGAVMASGLYSSSLDGTSKPLTIGAKYDQSQPWKGHIDDLRITNGVARYCSNFTPPGREMSTYGAPIRYDPYLLDVVVGMHMDGADNGVAFTEFTGKSVTVAGNTCTKVAVKKFGTASAYFDGTGDYLSVADSGGAMSLTADFTVECWINLASTSRQTIVAKGLAGDMQTFCINTDGVNSRSFELWMANASSGWAINGATSGTNKYTVGRWHHLALVRYGSSVVLYVDGVAAITQALTGSPLTNSYPVLVGGGGLYSASVNGHIDDLRITKGVARYKANFQPPQYVFPEVIEQNRTILDKHYDNVAVNMHFNGSMADEKGNSFAVTIGTPVITSAQSKFGGSSLYMPGASSLTCAVAPWQTFGTGDFTMEAWVKREYTAQFNILACNINGSTGYQWSISNTGVMNLAGAGQSANGTLRTNDTEWHHYAISRVAGVLYMFDDGKLIFSGAFAHNLVVSTNPFRIGNNGSGSSFQGWLDDFRVTVGVGRYKSSFSLPIYPNPDYKVAPL